MAFLGREYKVLKRPVSAATTASRSSTLREPSPTPSIGAWSSAGGSGDEAIAGPHAFSESEVLFLLDDNRKGGGGNAATTILRPRIDLPGHRRVEKKFHRFRHVPESMYPAGRLYQEGIEVNSY